MKEWMAQTDPSKEASTFERMNGRQQLPFRIKRYTTLMNGRLQVAFRNKDISLTKNIMLQIDFLNSGCS